MAHDAVAPETSHEYPGSYNGRAQNIEAGSWFSKLSQPLRHAILRAPSVRRLHDGAPLATRGAPAEDWCGVASGAVRISSVSLAGKQVTLTYVEPGTWFGDIALFDGLPRTHDANAHGQTTLLVVRKPDFKELLAQHVELYEALLRLNCRRLRLMFDPIEDLNTRPLAARLAKQILLLARSYGIDAGRGNPHRPAAGAGRPGAAAGRLAPARQPGTQGLRA